MEVTSRAGRFDSVVSFPSPASLPDSILHSTSRCSSTCGQVNKSSALARPPASVWFPSLLLYTCMYIPRPRPFHIIRH
jgi:hypothetical protein